jgi:hypothetical protein
VWGTVVVVVMLIIIGSAFYLQSSGTPRPRTYADIGMALGGGRVERPDPGFAITIPPGWQAWAPSTGWQDWWGADTVVQLWLEPSSDAETWWMSTCDVGEECTRERMVEAGGEAYCWVLDDTALAVEAEWKGPPDPAAATAGGLAEQDGWTQVGTAATELLSGEASMVRAVDPNGWPQEMWHVTDGDRWFRLICGMLDSDIEPRSIAETIEFLPLAPTT